MSDPVVPLTIDQAIDEGAKEATEEYGAPPITPLERYAVAGLADWGVDFFRGSEADADMQERIGVWLARAYAESPLLRKVLAAYHLEFTVCDKGLPDGIVGQAIDAAIAQLTPYARANQPVWWANVMEDGQ